MKTIIHILTVLAACGIFVISASAETNEQAYQDDGCAAGTSDAEANMSMAYERHSDQYDSQFEPYFAKGYKDCWQDTKSQMADESNTGSANSNDDVYFQSGCEAGKSDAEANMSMAYERHADQYDSRFEPAFKSGYQECWQDAHN